MVPFAARMRRAGCPGTHHEHHILYGGDRLSVNQLLQNLARRQVALQAHGPCMWMVSIACGGALPIDTCTDCLRSYAAAQMAHQIDTAADNTLVPVAQKVHPIWQPICEETHRVARFLPCDCPSVTPARLWSSQVPKSITVVRCNARGRTSRVIVHDDTLDLLAVLESDQQLCGGLVPRCLALLHSGGRPDVVLGQKLNSCFGQLWDVLKSS